MKSISLQNFKQFNELHIDGFKRINLISGSNNSGKSSLLEAIYALSRMNHLYIFQILITVLVSRPPFQYNVPNYIDSMKNLFYKFELSNSVVMESELTRCTLDYEDLPSGFLLGQSELGANITLDTKKVDNRRRLIKVNLANSTQKISGKVYDASAKLDDPDAEFFNSIQCFFVDENNIIKNELNQNSGIDELSKLIENNLEKELVSNALKIFDENMLSIAISAVNQISQIMIEHKDFTSKIPLSSYGGGVKRVLNIIMCIMRCQDGIVLIDEIENGIHYSIMPKLWKIIFELTQKYNCQVFATTHSKEYTDYIVAENTGWEKHKDEFCFVTLNNYSGKIIPSVYNGSQFEGALDFNSELRG